MRCPLKSAVCRRADLCRGECSYIPIHFLRYSRTIAPKTEIDNRRSLGSLIFFRTNRTVSASCPFYEFLRCCKSALPFCLNSRQSIGVCLLVCGFENTVDKRLSLAHYIKQQIGVEHTAARQSRNFSAVFDCEVL